MKSFKLLMIIGVSFLMMMTACEGLDQPTVPINIPGVSIEFEVGEEPTDLMIKSFYDEEPQLVLLDTVFDVNLNQKLENQGYSLGQVESLKLTNVSIDYVPQAEDSSAFDMSVFESMEFYMGEGVLVAQADSASQETVYISVEETNLLEELNDDQIRVRLLGQEVPVVKVRLRFNADFQAQVQVLE